MRKKALFYALIASGLFVGCLASCNDKSTANTSSSVAETSSSTSTGSSQTQSYNLVDDETARKVYNEYLKSLTNITYDDFLMNGKRNNWSQETVFLYKGIEISLDLNGSFKKMKVNTKNQNNVQTEVSFSYINNEWVKTSEDIQINDLTRNIYQLSINEDGTLNFKNEYTYDESGNQLTSIHTRYQDGIILFINKCDTTYDANGNILTRANFKYINDEWVKESEYKSINNELEQIYYLKINDDDTFDYKSEYTYDDNGNQLTKLEYKYINDEWIKVKECKYINNEEKQIYNISFNLDGMFSTKSEYTYDESGNRLTRAYSKYINDEWVKYLESKYIGDEEKTLYSISFNSEDEFDYKIEYTYDENGNRLTDTYSKYINDQWVKYTEYKYINNERKTVYETYSKLDGTFDRRYEYTFDDKGNQLSYMLSMYKNNSWTYSLKSEYTYDESGNQLSWISSNYIDGDWTYDFKYEFSYDNNGNELNHIVSNYENNSWTYSCKYEYTYDDNGNKLTEVYSDYLEDAWIKTRERRYINNMEKTTCSIALNDDGTFNFKNEYTYDESGNQLTRAYFEYKNGEWVKIEEFRYYGNETKNLYSLTFKDDGTYDYIYEYTYDDNRKMLTSKITKYIDGDWVKVEEWKYFDDRRASIYYISFNDDGTFKSKYESTYNDNGIKLTSTTFIYRNNNWVKKEVYKYFNNGLTGKSTYYLNDTFDALYEYEYDDNGVLLSSRSLDYYNNSWHVWRERE